LHLAAKEEHEQVIGDEQHCICARDEPIQAIPFRVGSGCQEEQRYGEEHEGERAHDESEAALQLT
jgi:hypothetical protein